jgi:hypothetical protein
MLDTPCSEVVWKVLATHCIRQFPVHFSYRASPSAITFHVDSTKVDCVWNVMAHGTKPDFVFRRNGRVHLNRRGASVQSTTGSRGVRISSSNAGYTMFWGSVRGTGYPLHSASFPFTSPPVRHRAPSHINWTLPSYVLVSVCIHAWSFRCALYAARNVRCQFTLTLTRKAIFC